MQTAEADPARITPRVHAADVPLSVYVHLPWCVKKCPYCDFNSHRAPGQLPEQAYVEALLADWRLAADGVARPVESVFFGGGTPSLFSAASIARILAAIDAITPLARDCEITLEANPGTTERGRFADLRAAGVNRLSLGVQSLDNDCLAALGRIHDAADAEAAIADARAAGFERLNCDLMFGLPQQTLAGGIADLKRLIALAPGHISYYQLTLEPNTPFYRTPPDLPDDDTVADIFDAGTARLEAAGFNQYEVSAWTQPDVACRHNDNYWRFGDYIGIGAGAHGKLSGNDGEIRRTARLRWPTGYMSVAGTPAALAEQRTPDAETLRFECLLNALRRRQGLGRHDYETRTGLNWADLLDHVARPLAGGLLVADGNGLRASDRGWHYLDDILAELVP